MKGLSGPRLLASAALVAVAATGCGSSSGAAAADPRAGVPTEVPVVVPTATPVAAGGPALPLTGLPAPSAAAATTPVVAVAVETGTGLPAPVGLGEADVVYVSFPSSGRQRALALFQSRDSGRVGPVADTRPLDSKLLLALGAVLEHSGGTSGFVKQVDRAELPSWSSLVHPSSFAADRATGAVYGSTAAARAADGVQPARPGLLPFADAAATGATPAPVRIAVAGQAALTLTWDAPSATWRGAVGSLPLAAANVVVQQVDAPALVLPKTGGRTEANPDPNGSGPATVLAGPTVGAGASWNRPGGTTNTKYVLSGGVPARLVPGTTWVLLVPTGSPVQTP